MPSYWPPKLWLGLSLWAVILWWITLPQSLIIADEKAYYEQAASLASGDIYTENHLAAQWPGYIPKHYPLGTACVLALGVGLGGSAGAFAAILLAWLSSGWVLRYGSAYFWNSGTAAWIVFVFPPAVIMSRHLMSEIPSLLVLSLWVAACLRLWRTPSAQLALAAGFWAGLSLLFREANLLLVLPWLMACAILKPSIGRMALPGFVLALGIRLISAWWAYGDPFYLKAPGVGFSLSHIPANLSLYLLGLLVFLPGGLWVILQYKGPWRASWQWGLGLYLALHLAYGYAGNHDNWQEGLVLGLRYLIPTLPLWVCAYADYLSRSARWLRLSQHWVLIPVAALLIAIGYTLDNQLNQDQLALREQLIQQKQPICEKEEWYEYCSSFYD